MLRCYSLGFFLAFIPLGTEGVGHPDAYFSQPSSGYSSTPKGEATGSMRLAEWSLPAHALLWHASVAKAEIFDLDAFEVKERYVLPTEADVEEGLGLDSRVVRRGTVLPLAVGGRPGGQLVSHHEGIFSQKAELRWTVSNPG